MNKVASYLQEHILGEVLTDSSVRDYFATDGSIFKVTPSMVVYPKNIQDVRKVARFAWQLAEKKHVLPITARGRGSDQTGAAIGKGVALVFPAHMNRLLEVDIKQRLARMQPGLNFLAFQQAMETHGLFLPPYPSSIAYATLGGAIANNSSGEKTVKYGSMRGYIVSLEVVLANGEVIQTGRINKRELEKRKGYTTFEGEIYRQVDGIISDNWDLVQERSGLPDVSKNTAGYAISDVRRKDGSVDLTPLFIGSQGTLGIITEAIVRLEPYNAQTTLFKIDVQSAQDITDVVEALQKVGPSALEIVDKNLLDYVDKISPNRLKNIVEKPYPPFVLLAEFDDKNNVQKKKAKTVRKALKKSQMTFMETQDYDEQQRLWAIRHSAALLMWHTEGKKKALPIIEDGIVPREKFAELIAKTYALFQKYGLEAAVWGHAGDANLHMQPFLDLASISDRQKVTKIMDEYYEIVVKLGGSTNAEHGDGRLRAPYLPDVYGKEMYKIFQQIKSAFDPYGTLNTGVKIDVTQKELASIMRKEYSMEHLADYLPCS